MQQKGAFLDRSGRHCGLLRNPSAAEEEHYSLVVTVAGRDNERAQLYTQIQTRIDQQAVVWEQQRAKMTVVRLQN